MIRLRRQMRVRFLILVVCGGIVSLPLTASKNSFSNVSGQADSPKKSVSNSSSNAGVAQAIDVLLATPVAAQAQWGISVMTLDGRVVVEKNAAQYFEPASNAKLVTTAAALSLLGPGTTIVTRVIAASVPDAQGVVRGDVSLMGAGDARLSGETDGRTGTPGALAQLADQLRQRGVRRIEGSIVGDDTLFPWEPYAQGWAWGDLEWSWGAPVSALTVDDNVVALTISPGARAGDALRYAWMPEIASRYYVVSDAGVTTESGTQAALGLDRPLGSRDVRIFGTLPVGSSTRRLLIAAVDPAELAALEFRQMLMERGIVVAGGGVARHRPAVDTAVFEKSVMRPLALPVDGNPTAPELAAPVSASAVVLGSWRSPPLLDDVTRTNKMSLNLHAELMLRLLGKQIGDDGSMVEGSRVTRAFLLRAGVEPQDFFFYDASGLSPQDRITPRAMTALLRYAAAQPWGAEFRGTLPVGGVDGTLAARFTHAGMRGRVFAKTGTLDEVNALSGYVTAASGKMLVFSILCNGHLPGSANATQTTQVIDEIVAAAAAAE